MSSNVREARVVLRAEPLEPTLRFFTDVLGLRLEWVLPADDPRTAVVSGHGVCLELQRGAPDAGLVRLVCRDPAAIAGGVTELTAPNGTRIELLPADPPLVVPPLRPSFAVTKMRGGALAADAWAGGRAGMRYRDLVPGRQGGRFLASHIRIDEGGPVPDYVHFHAVRFQIIYCVKGWVKVVYEDQGTPFVLAPGDCVLQPPRIRHRVLESSAGLEVVEVSSPADHPTFADHALDLPTPAVRASRDFEGQRFVRHEASRASWAPWRAEGFAARDLGIGVATAGIVEARVVRAQAGGDMSASRHAHELIFGFVLDGEATLEAHGRDPERLGRGDAFVVPPEMAYALRGATPALELLEIVVAA